MHSGNLCGPVRSTGSLITSYLHVSSYEAVLLALLELVADARLE